MGAVLADRIPRATALTLSYGLQTATNLALGILLVVAPAPLVYAAAVARGLLGHPDETRSQRDPAGPVGDARGAHGGQRRIEHDGRPRHPDRSARRCRADAVVGSRRCRARHGDRRGAVGARGPRHPPRAHRRRATPRSTSARSCRRRWAVCGRPVPSPTSRRCSASAACSSSWSACSTSSSRSSRSMCSARAREVRACSRRASGSVCSSGQRGRRARGGAPAGAGGPGRAARFGRGARRPGARLERAGRGRRCSPYAERRSGCSRWRAGPSCSAEPTTSSWHGCSASRKRCR